jgi:hypothetical protein
VQHHLSKSGVEKLIEPARAAQGHGQGPVDHRIALIIFARESRKIKAAVRSPAGKASASGDGGFGCHAREIRAGSRRLLLFFGWEQIDAAKQN